MIYYLDASLVVAACTNETKTAAVYAWLGKRAAGELAVSDWVVTEFSSALSLKVRIGHLTVADRGAALSAFSKMRSVSFALLSVTPAHFRTAASYADRRELGLTAGDSLHLAVAIDHGATLCTLDKKLARAATTVGASVHTF